MTANLFKYLLIISTAILMAFSSSAAAIDDCVFIENKGQWDDMILFAGQAPGLSVRIKSNEIVFDFFRYEFERNNDFLKSASYLEPKVRKGQVITMRFENSFLPEVIGSGITVGKTNFIVGNDSGKWKTGINRYEKVILKDIYPGIELHLSFDSKRFRYDFLITPGADPNQISIRFDGAEDIDIDDKEIILETCIGDIIHKDIKAFGQSSKRVANCSFIEKDDKLIGFEVSDYDKSETLVIDPIVFATYLGGGNYEYAKGLAIDDLANVYVTGHTSSYDFPVTDGAYSEYYKAGDGQKPDIFVSKLDSTGGKLIYSTYIGSFEGDYAEDIAIDGSGNVYLTGYTNKSTSFPITGQGILDSAHNGGFDVFVLKLGPGGSELLWSTLLGGLKDDFAQAISVDETGAAYICGYTTSSDFPVGGNPFQEEQHGLNDCFISKIGPNAQSLEFSTLAGGSSEDFGQGIAIDSLGFLYIVGITRSDDFPISPDALDPTYNDADTADGVNDVFVMKLNPDASSLVYSSYFGGASEDGAYDIVLDSDLNFYITGYSESWDFPVTPGAFDTTYNNTDESRGQGDIIISGFESGGNRLIYSTYLGGIGTDRGFAIDIDLHNVIYVTGTVGSADFPVTDDALDPEITDSTKSDAFYTKLTPDGSLLFYSSFLGGSDSDFGKDLAAYGDGSSFICGTTSSNDFPVTQAAYDTTFNDSAFTDIFVARVKSNRIFVNAGPDLVICSGTSATLTASAIGAIGDVSFTWTPADGLDDPYSASPAASSTVSRTYTVAGTDGQGNYDSDELVLEVLPGPDAHIFGARNVLRNLKNRYAAYFIEGSSYSWTAEGGDITLDDDNYFTEVLWRDDIDGGTLKLIVEGANGCLDSSIIAINVSEDDFKPELVPYGSLTFCDGDSVVLDAGSDYIFYLWSDGTRSRFDTVFTQGDYWVAVTDSKSRSRVSDTLRITVLPLPPVPVIDTLGGELLCLDSGYAYQWFYEGEKIPGATERSHKPEQDGAYRVMITNLNGCSNISTVFYVGENSIYIPADAALRIYPNPFEEYLLIEIPKVILIKRIEIYDILGRTLLRKNMDESNRIAKISTDAFVPGIYYLRAQTITGKSFTFPLVRK